MNRDEAAIMKNTQEMWLWSDPLFWMIAHKCLELDACQHATLHTANARAWQAANGGPIRCHECGQII